MDENIKLTDGTFFINDREISEITSIESFEPENVYAEDMEPITLSSNAEATIECTTDCNGFRFFEALAFWKQIYKVCPNKRVKHLMLNGKTKRVRLKNYQRAFDIVYKALRKNAIQTSYIMNRKV